MSNKLVRVVSSGSGLRRVNSVAASVLNQQPTWDTGAPDDRRFETIIQNSVFDPACLSVVLSGGGGSGDWILSAGIWNDAGVWDDASTWRDAA